MEKCYFLGFSRPTMHRFFAQKKMEEKYFEFAMEQLLWQLDAITLQSMARDACQVYINSLGINRLTRLCILCFEIASRDAKSVNIINR